PSPSPLRKGRRVPGWEGGGFAFGIDWFTSVVGVQFQRDDYEHEHRPDGLSTSTMVAADFVGGG
ncbi:MAG: hypothetical protein ACK5OB_20035, partial [Pirellula sp.]